MQHIARRTNQLLPFRIRQFTMATPRGSTDTPIERAIHEKVSPEFFPRVQPLIRWSSQLTTVLQPSVLTITNDSWQHRHHAAMRDQDGGNGETRKFRTHTIFTPVRPHVMMTQIFLYELSRRSSWAR